jgi:thiol-disulfide isomerase/thioredoxin
MTLCRSPFIVAAASIVAACAIGAAADAPPDARARLDSIKADVAAARTAFEAARSKLPDPLQEDPAVTKLWEAYDAKRDAGRDAAVAIAAEEGSSDVGFDAVEWVLADVQAFELPQGKAALQLATRFHAADPRIGKAIALVAYFTRSPRLVKDGDAAALMKAVLDTNPDRAARAQAALGLAFQKKWAFELAEIAAQKDPARAPALERAAAELGRAMEAVERNYGDCPNLRTRGRPLTATIGEQARFELNALRNLRVGRPAPEIDAEDLAGQCLVLTGQRGKVVLLVFWASWCNPCMQAVPHEKELVERFRGRPFELLGVNGDGDKSNAARAIAANHIPWRSFWNGPGGGDGPISRAWNVDGWPTVYVIDHRGTIRYRDLHGPDLDAPLEKLVSDAEAAARARRHRIENWSNRSGDGRK